MLDFLNSTNPFGVYQNVESPKVTLDLPLMDNPLDISDWADGIAKNGTPIVKNNINEGPKMIIDNTEEVNITPDRKENSSTKYSKTSKEVMNRAVKVAKQLISNGNFTKEQAAAIAGVMIDENKVDPSSYNKAEKAGKGAKGTSGFGYGAGIGSWTFADAKNALLTANGYAANTPIESLSLDDQVNLLITDSNGRMKKYYDALRRTKNLEDASATAVLITGGVGKSKNWDTHPTTAEAKALSDWYGKSNDARFGKSPYHWDLDVRRLNYAKQVLKELENGHT